MAIDTAEKRKSISGINNSIMVAGVTPNATNDQEWRQQSGWGYSGILAVAANIVIPEILRGVSIMVTRVSGQSIMVTRV